MGALRSKSRLAVRVGLWSALASSTMVGPIWAGSGEGPTRSQIAEGARLFLTDWSTVNRVGLDGDGLGPMYNERSCVACHEQGGPGGAGGSRVDVMILTDVGSSRKRDGTIEIPKSVNPTVVRPPLSSDRLPGFATSPSLVLHRFSTDKGFDPWRLELLTGIGAVPRDISIGSIIRGRDRIRTSYRNTPALFGSGLIDAIPESAIEEASHRVFTDFPTVKGRIVYQEDGRIGRFGWKSQTATLGDFVRIACANELGLENPGHPQSPDARRPEYKAPGIDLTDAECTALTAFVAALRRPVEPIRPALLRAENLNQGRLIFGMIGCATCHLPSLGEVSGLYTDLLLHDMGQDLSDAAEYYGTPTSPGLAFDAPKTSEWRTPPLWGLRDSAPYLHDGRAATIPAAIALHGGQAERSTGLYQRLDREQKNYLHEFLRSLAAPPEADARKKPRSR